MSLCETQHNGRGGIMVLRNASIKATDCTSLADQARRPAPHTTSLNSSNSCIAQSVRDHAWEHTISCTALGSQGAPPLLRGQ